MENRRITVDGSTYELRPWSYKDGRRWLFKLTKIGLGAAGQVGNEMAALSVILEGVDEPLFEDFADTCVKYTDLVSGDARNVQPLATVAAMHMCGRHVDLVAIMKGHIEVQFADFFGRIGELLGSGGGSGPAK